MQTSIARVTARNGRGTPCIYPEEQNAGGHKVVTRSYSPDCGMNQDHRPAPYHVNSMRSTYGNGGHADDGYENGVMLGSLELECILICDQYQYRMISFGKDWTLV